MDPTLFSDGDTWGVEWRGRAASLAGPAAALIIHCSVQSGVVPPKSWVSKARELARVDGVPAVLREMLAGSLTSRSTAPVRVFEIEGRRLESVRPGR